MLDQQYDLKTYMEEIQPIVTDYHQTKEFVNQFEHNLALLKDEAIRCNDNLTILQCWQDGIGRTLQQDYPPEILLDLHGHPDATLSRTGTIFSIQEAGNPVIEFHLCSHLMYTPVVNDVRTSHCLKC